MPMIYESLDIGELHIIRRIAQGIVDSITLELDKRALTSPQLQSKSKGQDNLIRAPDGRVKTRPATTEEQILQGIKYVQVECYLCTTPINFTNSYQLHPQSYKYCQTCYRRAL